MAISDVIGRYYHRTRAFCDGAPVNELFTPSIDVDKCSAADRQCTASRSRKEK
jgi:hypothetical protein